MRAEEKDGHTEQMNDLCEIQPSWSAESMDRVVIDERTVAATAAMTGSIMKLNGLTARDVGSP